MLNLRTDRMIVRPASPDRLDSLLQVNASLGWLALLVLSSALAGAFVWSCVSTAPIKVLARGMLLSSLGIADVVANADGRVIAVEARVGAAVRQGDVVAELGQPDIADRLEAKRLELASLEDERRRLAEFQARVRASQDQLAADRTAGLQARIASLKTRAESLATRETNLRGLATRGIELQSRVLDVTTQRASAEDELAQAQNALIQLDAEREARVAQDARELMAADMKIANAQRDIDLFTGLLKRGTKVHAPADGTVVELTANPGDAIRAGAPVMRMLRTTDQLAGTLRAMIYVPGADGKRVRPGMPVQVIPANARLERDGYIRGRVMSVADLPATPESMLRVLKNSSLVDQLASKGPPFEVVVELQPDPGSVSGFSWSTGRGVQQPLDSGTIAEAKFVVDRIPLIGLVIPRAETVLVWLRARLP